MRRILTTAGDSLHEMGHIVVLLALFIYIFALVGMKLYSGKFWFRDEGVAAPWDEVGDWPCRQNRVSITWSHGATFFRWCRAGGIFFPGARKELSLKERECLISSSCLCHFTFHMLRLCSRPLGHLQQKPDPKLPGILRK